jgi:hypothetical protein
VSLVLHYLGLMRTFFFFSSIVMVLVFVDWVVEEEKSGCKVRESSCLDRLVSEDLAGVEFWSVV